MVLYHNDIPFLTLTDCRFRKSWRRNLFQASLCFKLEYYFSLILPFKISELGTQKSTCDKYNSLAHFGGSLQFVIVSGPFKKDALLLF